MLATPLDESSIVCLRLIRRCFSQLRNVKLDPALYGAGYNTPVVAYAYDLAGNRTQRTLMNGGGQTSYSLDDANRMYSQVSSFANGQTGRFDYGFDRLNRRRYEQRDLGLADGFQFNERDEVVGYQHNGTLHEDWSVTEAAATGTLALDGTGNRTQVTGSWAPNTYSVNTLNQYTHDFVGDAHYDPKGNLDGYAGWTLTYDAMNRLVELHNGAANQHIYYRYDALNRRVAQSVNGVVTSYVFDNWNRIEERATDGTQPHCYLFGAATNEVVVSFGSGYQNYWYFQDGRGNTSHLVNGPNEVVERYTYDLNGDVSYFDGNGVSMTASALKNPFLFAGAILLPETSLYDMRNRIYFPRWGRFLQTDPIGFKGDASNLYRYCGNDFVDHTDPTGLYVTYSDGWSKADAENFKTQFEREWRDPQGRANWKAAYASTTEWRIKPDRSSGTPAMGAQRFTPTNYDSAGKVIPYHDPRSFGQKVRDTLREVASQIGMAGQLPRNWKSPTNDPQLPPSEVPEGFRVQRRGPTEGYPNGNWKVEKQIGPDRWQAVDARTLKPSTRENTHVPFPSEYKGPYDY